MSLPPTEAAQAKALAAKARAKSTDELIATADFLAQADRLAEAICERLGQPALLSVYHYAENLEFQSREFRDFLVAHREYRAAQHASGQRLASIVLR